MPAGAKAWLPAAVLCNMALAGTHMLTEDSGSTRPALLGVSIAAGSFSIGLAAGAAGAATLECRLDRVSGAVTVTCGSRSGLSATAALTEPACDAAATAADVINTSTRLASMLALMQHAKAAAARPVATAAAALSPDHAPFAFSLALQSAATLQQAARTATPERHRLPTLSACAALLPDSILATSGAAAADRIVHLSPSVESARRRATSHELACSSAAGGTLLAASGLVHVLRQAPGGAAVQLAAGTTPVLQTVWLPWQPQAAVAAKPAKWAVLSFRQACPLAAICRASAKELAAVSSVNLVLRPAPADGGASGGKAEPDANVRFFATEAELVEALRALRPDHVFCVQLPLAATGVGAPLRSSSGSSDILFSEPAAYLNCCAQAAHVMQSSTLPWHVHRCRVPHCR